MNATHCLARLVRLLTAGVLLVPLAGWAAVTARAERACLNASAVRNQWNAVPTPSSTVALAELDRQPCDLIAATSSGTIWRSDNGGADWQRAGTVSATPTAVYTTGLPAGTAFVSTVPPPAPSTAATLFVTRDAGSTFTPVVGLPDANVTAVTGTGSGSKTVLASIAASVASPGSLPSVSGGVAPTVYSSSDGGSTFTPEAGSTGLDPLTLSVDPTNGSNVWVASTGAASLDGLFASSTGGAAFTQQMPPPAPGVLAAAIFPQTGGGLRALAGTADTLYAGVGAGGAYQGLNGTVWQKVESDGPVRAVAFEYDHPFTFMAVVGNRVQRISSNSSGFRVRTAEKGLPAGCRPDSLTRDASVPSTFLLHCAALGKFYRYRSDGSDLSATDNPFPPPLNLPASPPFVSLPMQVLRSLSITVTGSADSGAVAFDGRWLYLADENAPGQVYRMSPATGAFGGVLQMAINYPIATLTYDSLRGLLYVEDLNGNVYSYDQFRRLTRFMFSSPVAQCNASSPCGDSQTNNNVSGRVGSFSYDPSIDRFVGVDDTGTQLELFTRTGMVTSSCTIPVVPTDTNPGGIANPGTATEPGSAAVVASGDGQSYVEMEDDKTVFHIDDSCNTLGAYTHRTYSEASDENDSMACDTVTFGQPAIWIRDSGLDAVQAYAVPNGYCPLATDLSTPAQVRVLAGTTTRICSTLRLAGNGSPVPGQRINVFMASRPVGVATTDRNGHACVPYATPRSVAAPQGRLAPGLPRPPVAAAPRVTAAPLLAVFDGTIAYRPASASSRLLTLHPAPPVALRIAAPAAAVAIAVAPLPPNPPPPAPPAATKPQPVAQGNPGAQPGVVAQPGAAAHREEESETAAQTADEGVADAAPVADAQPYSELGGSSGVLPGAFIAFGIAAAALQLRRRRSRVREQSVW